MQNLQTAQTNSDWQYLPLGTLCQKIRGVSYTKGEALNQPRTGYVPILRANNIDDNGLNYNDLIFVPKERVSEKQFLKKGDVVIAMSSGSKKVVGKAAQLNEDWQGAFGAFCGVLRLTSCDLNPKYFGYYFSSLAYRNYISEVSSGTNINNLKAVHFDSINFPVAPKQRQDEIVCSLDKLFPIIKSNSARLYKARKLVRRFRHAILSAAMTGKLTEEWREKNNQVENRYSNSVNSSAYPEIPVSWHYANFQDCAIKITDGTHHSPANSATGDYKYITAKNIKEWGLDLSYLTYVDSKTHKEIYSRCDVKKGDVLYIKDGATAGIALVNPLDEEFSLLSSVGVLRFDDKEICSEFVSYYLNSPDIKRIMLEQVSGAAITRLTLTKIKLSLLAVPPIVEQKEIVKQLKKYFDIADQIERQIEKAEARVSRLTQAVLAKTFKVE